VVNGEGSIDWTYGGVVISLPPVGSPLVAALVNLDEISQKFPNSGFLVR
jgi:hypothetical protein